MHFLLTFLVCISFEHFTNAFLAPAFFDSSVTDTSVISFLTHTHTHTHTQSHTHNHTHTHTHTHVSRCISCRLMFGCDSYCQMFRCISHKHVFRCILSRHIWRCNSYRLMFDSIAYWRRATLGSFLAHIFCCIPFRDAIITAFLLMHFLQTHL
jgi:hypothetical protein